MFPFIATYVLFAALLAVVDRFTARPLFIRTQLKHLPWKLNYSFRWWGPQEYWAALTMVAICSLFFLGFWHAMGGAFYRDAGQALFIPIALGSTVLAIRHFHLVKHFKAHAWWLTLIVALPTLGVGIFANAYADAYILQITRVDAAKFPLAQKALTTLLMISLWLFAGVVLISCLVFAFSFVISARSPTFVGVIKRDPVKVLAWRKHAPGILEHRRSVMLMVVFIGAITTVSIAMSFIEYVLRHSNDVLQETLIFSSFHLHPRDCGIPGWTSDEWIALVGEKRGVMAVPGVRGYEFEEVDCDMQSHKALRQARLRQLRSDDYL